MADVSNVTCVCVCVHCRYCAGTVPWGHPGEHQDFEPQRHDDGCIEVIGFTMTSLVSSEAGTGRTGTNLIRIHRVIIQPGTLATSNLSPVRWVDLPSVLGSLSASLTLTACVCVQATLQVGGHGERLHQCKQVTLTTYKSIPMQVDGEPCKLAPSVISISLRNQANMVQKAKRRISMPHLNE